MNIRITQLFSALALCAVFGLSTQTAEARDWYISIKRGKGKKGTKEKPAKQLGNVIKKLEAGDVVHIAEGVYKGRGDCGYNQITVPVSIIGGYDDSFSKRDPWGKHRTVFAGDNMTKNYGTGGLPALFLDLSKYKNEAKKIVVDGLIIDHGYRNRYADKTQAKLVPKANPKSGANPSPSMGALVIRVLKSGKFDRGPRWDITVQNCIVMNAYQNQGALSVAGYKGSKITIKNNAVLQSSGASIFCGSKWRGAEKDNPSFLVENNTVLFTWDSGFSQCFSIHFDKSTNCRVKNNVFGLSDLIGINNDKGAKNLLLKSNLVFGHRKADYAEPKTLMTIGDIEDEADLLHDDSEENVSELVTVPVSKDFALLYGSRVVVDREKAEADAKAANSGANALRGILGLPQQAGKVKWPKTPCYMNRLSVDDAVKAAEKQYKGHGCQKPK